MGLLERFARFMSTLDINIEAVGDLTSHLKLPRAPAMYSKPPQQETSQTKFQPLWIICLVDGMVDGISCENNLS